MTSPIQLPLDFDDENDDDTSCIICGELLNPPTTTVRGIVIHKECAIMDGLIEAEDDEGN